MKEIEAAGAQVVAISYDSTSILRRFAGQNGITFPLLSDPDSRVIDAFGIRNHEAPARWKGIPNPGTFVLGTNGVIRAKLFLDGYRDRHDVAALLQALRR